MAISLKAPQVKTRITVKDDDASFMLTSMGLLLLR